MSNSMHISFFVCHNIYIFEYPQIQYPQFKVFSHEIQFSIKMALVHPKTLTQSIVPWSERKTKEILLKRNPKEKKKQSKTFHSDSRFVCASAHLNIYLTRLQPRARARRNKKDTIRRRRRHPIGGRDGAASREARSRKMLIIHLSVSFPLLM